MNEKNDGRKYRYPDSLILVIGYIRAYLHPPCRHQTNRWNHKSRYKEPAKPSHLHSIRRANNLDIASSISSSELDDDDLTTAADGKGIKATYRGQRMHDKRDA